MFQTTSLNYDYTRWVKRPLTAVFFPALLSGKYAWPPAPLSQNSGLLR